MMEASRAALAPEQRQEIPRQRSGIRGTLGTAAVIATYFGWWIYTTHLQREAVAAIRALGGTIVYVDDMPFQDPFAAISWLEQKLGHDYTSAVGQVRFRGKLRGKDLSCLKDLRGLRALWLNDTDIDDGALVAISGQRRLEELSLCNTPITNAGLIHISGLSRLEFVYLPGTNVSDAGLVHLENLSALRRLDLTGTRVTAMGVRKLSRALPEAWIIY